MTTSDTGLGFDGREKVLVLPVDFLLHGIDVHPVADGVDSADMRACAKGHKDLGLPPDLVNPFHAVGSADGSLDKSDLVVITPVRDGFPKVDQLNQAQDVKDIVLEVQLRQLASLTRREVEKGHFRFAHWMASFRSLILP